MRDYITLGPVPAEENCTQVGRNRDLEIRECNAYKRQLERMFKLPDGMNFAVKSFEHDFGTYREVVIFYDPDCENHSNVAIDVDHNLPARWDEIAKIHLVPKITREELEKDLVNGPDSRY